MQGVERLLIMCATGALKRSRYDMTIPRLGGKRSAADQNTLYPKYSRADGYNKKSYHQTGMALDIIPVDGGYKNTKAFRHFAKCMFDEWQEMMRNPDIDTKGLVLQWGGHWQKFVDLPHYQLVAA